MDESWSMKSQDSEQFRSKQEFFYWNKRTKQREQVEIIAKISSKGKHMKDRHCRSA